MGPEMTRPRRNPKTSLSFAKLLRAAGFSASRVNSAIRGGASRRSAARQPRSASPLLLLAVVGVAVVAALFTYEVTYAERVYHGVNSQGVALGGLTRDEAQVALSQSAKRFAQTPIVLKGQTAGGKAKEWRTLPEDLGIRLEVADATDAAYSLGREGNIFTRIADQAGAFTGGSAVGQARLVVDGARRGAFLAGIAREVDQPAAEAKLAVKSGDQPQFEVQKGKSGRKLNVDKTGEAIEKSIEQALEKSGGVAPTASALATITAGLSVDDLTPTVSETALATSAEKARKLTANPLTLRFRDRSWTLSPKQIAESLITTGASTDPDEEKLKKPLEAMARESETTPRNARFDYSGGILKVVSPGQSGQRIDVKAAASAVKAALLAGHKSVDLPGLAIDADFGPDDANKLLATGLALVESASTPYDVGSNDRRTNVELATSRVHGVVVPPGGVFSFNDEVGEVSYKSGYKQGYGISRDADGDVITIPSEGGGICQVATTLFHSIFSAGYPIVERHWHSYWIPRYGMPPKGMKGLDATIDQVYDKQGKLVAEIDLRFKNSTDSPILIQARTDKTNVTFQIYGAKPKWTVKIDQPKISDVVKADTTPVRQADSTLAPGAEVKIEEARDGFTSSITRTITQDGKEIEQRAFVAKYAPSHDVTIYGPKATPTPAKPTATPKR
jgi:vancomycin resistance protein YoaR